MNELPFASRTVQLLTPNHSLLETPMSLPGRRKDEYRSAQHEDSPVSLLLRQQTTALCTLLSVVALSACGGSSDLNAVVAVDARSRLAFGPCAVAIADPSAVCGTLTVPENRADKASRLIGLPFAILPAVANAPARDPVKHAGLPHACSLCGSCTDVCPVRIPLHHQLLTWRTELPARGLRSRARRAATSLARFVMERPGLFAASGAAARLVGRTLPASWLARVATPWTRGRELPEFPRESFRALYAKRRRERGE